MRLISYWRTTSTQHPQAATEPLLKTHPGAEELSSDYDQISQKSGFTALSREAIKVVNISWRASAGIQVYSRSQSWRKCPEKVNFWPSVNLNCQRDIFWPRFLCENHICTWVRLPRPSAEQIWKLGSRWGAAPSQAFLASKEKETWGREKNCSNRSNRSCAAERKITWSQHMSQWCIYFPFNIYSA